MVGFGRNLNRKAKDDIQVAQDQLAGKLWRSMIREVDKIWTPKMSEWVNNELNSPHYIAEIEKVNQAYLDFCNKKIEEPAFKAAMEAFYQFVRKWK